MNGITPMKTCIDVAHGRLLVKRNLKLTNIIVLNHFDINHSWPPGKKSVAPFGSTITTFFCSTNPYKHGDEAKQWLLEDLILHICKRYKFYQHAKAFSYGS
jgi:hypothetical protein